MSKYKEKSTDVSESLNSVMNGPKRASGQSTVKNKQASDAYFDISERIKHIRFNLKVRKFTHCRKKQHHHLKI